MRAPRLAGASHASVTSAAPAVASAIVESVTHYEDAELLARVSRGLGPAMRGQSVASLPEGEALATRGW